MSPINVGVQLLFSELFNLKILMKKFQQTQLDIRNPMFFHNLNPTPNPFLRDHLFKRPLFTFP